MQGKCLCGMTNFKLSVPYIKAYQCHCSLCRMQSGTASNLGTIISSENFEWLSSRSHIKRWVKESGFTSDFCTNCGSPVPNELRDLPYYWVPVGALEPNIVVEVVAHFCIASKAEWDSIRDDSIQYDVLPDVPVFIKEINSWQKPLNKSSHSAS